MKVHIFEHQCQFLFYFTINQVLLFGINFASSLESNLPQKESSSSPEERFKKLFSMRRTQQLGVVKSILKYDPAKQEVLVRTVSRKIFDVIESSRVTLESSGFIPGLSEFPEDEEARDALSNILENTSLFGDILLHIPDIAIPVLEKNNKYDVLLKWSLLFVNQTQLLDKKTLTLMSLMSQELNITERHPDYINPYKKSYQNQMLKNQETKKDSNAESKNKKKKKKIQKGPRLSDEL